MDAEISCSRCMFALETRLPPPNIGSALECREGPPTPCVAFGQDRATGQPVPIGGFSMFPQVKPGEFCHRFQPKETSKLIA